MNAELDSHGFSADAVITSIASAEASGVPLRLAETVDVVAGKLGMLPRERGLRFTLGTSELEVFADAAPCELMETLNGPGARVAMKRLAGIHRKVITSGTIAVGDSVAIVW